VFANADSFVVEHQKFSCIAMQFFERLLSN